SPSTSHDQPQRHSQVQSQDQDQNQDQGQGRDQSQHHSHGHSPDQSQSHAPALAAVLGPLNPAQRRAAAADDGPLLIVAGAGTGKTQTLAHRVAALIARGADPRRILLLTFSRRAAHEMTRRAARLLATGRSRLAVAAGAGSIDVELTWAGTFHAVANRLLRRHAIEIGLDPSFTLLDREDAADLIDR